MCEAFALVRPLRGVAEHRRSVAQDDALYLRLERHFDIGGAFIDKAAPALCALPDTAKEPLRISASISAMTASSNPFLSPK